MQNEFINSVPHMASSQSALADILTKELYKDKCKDCEVQS